jgi:Coenzyme PQQ synthesis protein D (PqqD)
MTPGDDNQRMLAARVRVPDHVVYRWFEAETLLLNLNTGQYHGLNPTAGRMLQLLEETDGRIGEAAGRLAAEYEANEAEITTDMVELCSQLAERGLVEVDDESAA